MLLHYRKVVTQPSLRCTMGFMNSVVQADVSHHILHLPGAQRRTKAVILTIIVVQHSSLTLLISSCPYGRFSHKVIKVSKAEISDWLKCRKLPLPHSANL